MRKLGYIQIIISYLVFIFCFFYCVVINKDSENDLKPWVMILMIASLINLFVGTFWANRDFNKDGDIILKKENDKLEDILKFIVLLPLFIIGLPLLIIPLIILCISSISETFYIKKMFNNVFKKKGYNIYKVPKVHRYICSKDNIVVQLFMLTSYEISFDSGNTFVNIYDCHLGTTEEKDLLKKVFMNYQNAHPVDKQRGDVDDPTIYFLRFIDKYLK